MSSINSKEIVDKIIAGNGSYSKDDPIVVEILSYENKFDRKITYKLIYEGMDDHYIKTNLHGHNIQSIWKRK